MSGALNLPAWLSRVATNPVGTSTVQTAGTPDAGVQTVPPWMRRAPPTLPSPTQQAERQNVVGLPRTLALGMTSPAAPAVTKVAGRPIPQGFQSQQLDALQELAARGEPDIVYRDIFSTGAKERLRAGETWRGRLEKWISRQMDAHEQAKVP